MKILWGRATVLATALALFLGADTGLQAQGTAFTYQGRLNLNGSPASGTYDFQFILFNVNQFGFPAAPILTNTSVAVNNGLFTSLLDFGGGIFTGSNYWLEIGVRTNGAGAFSTLAPRQVLTPSPYAVFANTASNLSGVLPTAQLSGTFPASQLSGTVPLGQLPAALVTNNASSVNLNGSFAGNGGALTNLQIAALNPPGTFSLLPLYFAPAISYGVGFAPSHVAVADVNNDGKLDLISANLNSSTLTILTNNGSGGFGSNATLNTGNSPNFVVAITNVDGLGHMALVSANNGANTLTVLTNNSSGVFGFNATLPVGTQPECVLVVTNFDNHGHLALVSANSGANTLTVLTNNGSGVFTFSATLNVGNLPWSVITADVNGDGKPDLITANLFGASLTILTNNGSGTFGSNATVSAGDQTYSVAAGDINGDGKVDLICTEYNSAALTILTNNGSGQFVFNATVPAGSGPTYVVTADINGDGKTDLVSANYGASTVSVLTNNGSGVFGSLATLNALAHLQSVSAADLNGDGKVDLVTANYSGSTTLSVLLALPAPVPALSINGGINSPMWRLTSVISGQGALPLTGNFTSGGGTLMIFVSGSGYSPSAGALIGMDIVLDGNPIDSCFIFANPAVTHLAFVPITVRAGALAGAHTIKLVPRAGTTTDGTDYFRVTVQELPF
ncbi:FG-GAP repeat domain-containing protein [Pedosphaera parvula]|uniref:FG-GAP repeat protein n=1 Tax=Pedosphaera parvula (strain Ellin514) TaxID=320771 RepID=B9XQQ3_PEDPL|nr:VCBS repeat-containing protein [Pedosphaera parvula]EEF57835.1 FG-GAP repeat protein [Pedosphaera parvula Ellin514]